MLILYRKCFVPKMIYGLTGFYMNDKEIEQMELINRKILRNFAHLPKCTPKVALYNEFGTIPFQMEIYKRKMLMWHRLNDKPNKMIKNVKNQQIMMNLPWMKQVINIANELNIDLKKGIKLTKNKWKSEIKTKIRTYMKKYIEEEISKLKRYKEIIKDNIEPGEMKIYMSLTVKKAGAIFRARTGIMDPTPRKPYWKKSIWRCKLCNERSQETKHYILECEGTEEYFEEMSREQCWKIITALEGDKGEMKKLANIVQKIIKEINV